MEPKAEVRINWLLAKLQAADEVIATHAATVATLEKRLAREEGKHMTYRGNTQRRIDDMAATIRTLRGTPQGDDPEDGS